MVMVTVRSWISYDGYEYETGNVCDTRSFNRSEEQKTKLAKLIKEALNRGEEVKFRRGLNTFTKDLVDFDMFMGMQNDILEKVKEV